MGVASSPCRNERGIQKIDRRGGICKRSCNKSTIFPHAGDRLPHTCGSATSIRGDGGLPHRRPARNTERRKAGEADLPPAGPRRNGSELRELTSEAECVGAPPVGRTARPQPRSRTEDRRRAQTSLRRRSRRRTVAIPTAGPPDRPAAPDESGPGSPFRATAD